MTDYGSMPLIGILIGIVAGAVAAASDRSAGKWAALVGAVSFAIAWAVNRPEGFDIGPGHYQQPLAMQIGIGAISGAVWCGLWGLLGAKIGRKMAVKNDQKP
jgi:drug/metabolite transporter (DMT)-like permease